MVTALLLLIWICLKYLPFINSKRPRDEENNIETKIDVTQAEDNILPDWLRDRKEMLFPETAVIRGEQLGKGQFGTVFKGNLKQGNAMQVPDNEIIN